MNPVTGAHLIGSVPLPDAEAVFRTVVRELGPHLPRMPDGETGNRGRRLSWAETALYLGLIHNAAAVGDRVRIEAARKVVPRFGVTTECGWGCTDPTRLPGLLAARRAAVEAAWR